MSKMAFVRGLIVLWCLAELPLQADEGRSSFTPEAHGAKGDGQADDTAAVQAAVNAARAAGGGTVEFRAGAIYLVTSVDIMPGITLDGHGATVKRPAKTPGRFTRMFTTQNHPWRDDVDSPPLVVRDLVLDGNRQNQGPYLKYELEHAALLFLMGAQGADARKGRLRAVVENCMFKDSPADGPHVYTNVAARFSNCTAVDCFRGGLTVTGGHSIVQINNFWGKGETHPSGLQYEVDGGGFGGSHVTETVVSGMVIDGDFDCGLAPGSTFLGSNILCRRPTFHMYAPGSKVLLSNSMFAVGMQTGYGNRIVHPGDVTFQGCRFTISEAGEAGEADRRFAALDVYWNISGTAHKGLRLRLLDCVFDADDTVDEADTAYAIHTTPDVPTNDNRLIVDGGEVSEAYDYGLYLSQGGRAFLRGARIEAATGIHWSGPGDFPAEIEVDGVTTTGATAMHINTSNPKSVVTHRNVEVDETQAAISTTYGMANTYRGGRVIHVAASPVGRLAALAGDRARLRAPAVGTVYEWICTTTGPAGTATWKALTQVVE